jgi:hypothetical protein
MSKRYDYDIQVAKKIAKLTFEWCVKNLKAPKEVEKCYLTRVCVGNKHHQNKASYCNGDIRVYLKLCKSYSDVIRAIIHEYTHYIQFSDRENIKKYDEFYDIFGYWNNPFEVQARQLEVRYYQTCWYHVKKRCKDLKKPETV